MQTSEHNFYPVDFYRVNDHGSRRVERSSDADSEHALIQRGVLQGFEPTRRPGIRQKVLVGPEDSLDQNHVLIEADAGATVALHQIFTSETLLILSGTFEIGYHDGTTVLLNAGDTCHFRPNTSHGLRCVVAGQYHMTFAPAYVSKDAAQSAE